MIDVPQGYKQTEVGVIPEDWGIKPLSAVVAYTNGKAHEGCISDLGKYVVVNSKFISTNGEVQKYSHQRFSPVSKGDILMVMSDVPNGRAIARCFIVDRDDFYTVNQRICTLRPIQIDGKLLFYKLNRNPYYLAFDDGVKQTNLRKNDVLSCPLALPPTKAEQEAIAEALSDADALIESLEQLLTKKRHLKQGAMQELLTGKKRLPGFSGEWEAKRLGDLCERITTGKLDANAMVQNGEYPFFTCAKEHYWIDRYAFDLEALLVSGNGANVGYIHYYKGRFNAYQRTYVLSGFSCDIHFLKLFMEHSLQDRIRTEMNAGNTPYIVMGTLSEMNIALPLKKAEQTAIATILSDMDAELAALEEKLAKARHLKQGMMQELLTGRIRLV